jgi:hypothetical protein
MCSPERASAFFSSEPRADQWRSTHGAEGARRVLCVGEGVFVPVRGAGPCGQEGFLCRLFRESPGPPRAMSRQPLAVCPQPPAVKGEPPTVDGPPTTGGR